MEYKDEIDLLTIQQVYVIICLLKSQQEGEYYARTFRNIYRTHQSYQ